MLNKQEQIDQLLKKTVSDNHILAVYLFGSTARKENHPESDIDICLVLNTGSYQKLELSRIKLSYQKSTTLDIQVFQQLPMYIRKRVFKEGQLLYCRNEDQLYNLAFQFIREYADYEHIYREYLNEVARG